MRLPVLKDEKVAVPEKPLCPQCRRSKVLEPHSMAILCGGAMRMEKDRKSGGPHDSLDGFLSLTWHGAHGPGIGPDRDIYTQLYVAEECRGGQFEICFCSTKCLRSFLNSCVDSLEEKIASEKPNSERPAAP